MSLSASCDFSINIQMSSETVKHLKENDFQLLGFKAVKVSGKLRVPLVWFATDQYLVNTTISWSGDYQTYISSQLDLVPDQVIKPCPLRALTDKDMISFRMVKAHVKAFAIWACSSESIKLGENMIVDQYGNTTVEKSRWNNGLISIINNSSSQWTCGISQAISNSSEFYPLLTFSLYGGGNQCVLIPINKVALMFAPSSVKTGTVVTQSFASAIVVDLVDEQERNIIYDLNNGWSPIDKNWAVVIPSNSNLLEILNPELTSFEL